MPPPPPPPTSPPLPRPLPCAALQQCSSMTSTNMNRSAYHLPHRASRHSLFAVASFATSFALLLPSSLSLASLSSLTLLLHGFIVKSIGGRAFVSATIFAVSCSSSGA